MPIGDIAVSWERVWPAVVEIEKINTLHMQQAVVGLGKGQHEFLRTRALPTFCALRSYHIGAHHVGIRQVKVLC